MAKKKQSGRRTTESASKTGGAARAGGGKKRPRSPSKKRDVPSREDSPLSVTKADRFAVVGLGASAGGLDAFKQFFSNMPADSGMAFVLIQHLDPAHESLTGELLSRHTDMPVDQAEDEMRIRPNHVYVIPPNTYLTVSGEMLNLTEPVHRRGLRMPIDFFLRSLADDQQERAIGVILTGTGTDGTLGVREIKAACGMVMVQSPETCQFDGMARSAIATGMVDYVLPIDQMPDALIRYVEHWTVNGALAPPPSSEKTPDDLHAVVGLLRARIKYDFSCYKKGTLTRRIQRRMGLRHIESMAKYVEFLRQDNDEVNSLYKDLLIGVTNFFREPEAWQVLEQQVIIPLVKAHSGETPIRVWVPGCATGEEPYSIAMQLTDQLHLAEKACEIQIFASDIDTDALAFARAGVYPENIAADVPAECLRRFFIKGEHTYRINKEIRETVVFAEQNLISDPPFSKLDLISCRNLLIYLEAEVQHKILTLFHFALREHGYLLLGGSETIGPQHDLFEAVSRKHRIYRRIGPVRHSKLDFPLARANAPRTLPDARPGLPEPRNRRLALLAQHLVIDRFAPACVVVNRKSEVLYLHGPVDEYLQLPAGELAADIVAMAREGLRSKLRSALHRAIQEDRSVEVTGVRIRRGRGNASVRVTVDPLRQPREAEGLLLVSFHEGDAMQPAAGGGSTERGARLGNSAKPADQDADSAAGYEAVIRQLEEELRGTRVDLQSTIEELETSNEEFKAANEEVTSINEELQSTNEELETSKEELQSLNEELQTVNTQLEQKIQELESTYNDLNNLLTSTDVATIFLDRRFRLKRFTPATMRRLRVRETDVGRPISDFASNLTDATLLADVEQVLDRLQPAEAEVQDHASRWYLRRIVPYRTEDDRIDGVVITFTDITTRKEQEHELRELNENLEQRVAERTEQARRLVEEAPDAMIVVDRAGQILQVSRQTEQLFGYPRTELVGRSLEMLVPERFREQHREHRAQFFSDPHPRPAGLGLELSGLHKSGKEIPVEIQLNPLEMDGQVVTFAAVRDITQRKQAEQDRAGLAAIMQDASVAIYILELDGTIRNWTRGAELLYGYAAGEVVGKNVALFVPTDRRHEIEETLKQLQGGVTIRDYETVRRRKDGTLIHVAVTKSLVEHDGKVTGICTVTRDIHERKQLDQLMAELVDAERQRLGRELHDSLGQQVSALGIMVTTLRQRPPDEALPADALGKLEVSVEDAKTQLRLLTKGMFPVDVDADGLRVALDDLAEQTRQSFGIDCRFESPDPIPLNDNFVATQLYQIAREAVHNATKHAAARNIVIRLDQPNAPRMTITDDGSGLPGDVERSAGMGLRIMRHRASLIDAAFSLGSRGGGGTVVGCSLTAAPSPRNPITQ